MNSLKFKKATSSALSLLVVLTYVAGSAFFVRAADRVEPNHTRVQVQLKSTHDEGGEKMEIKEVIEQYEKSLNASDTESILKLYGKDPVFMPQHAPAQVGRDQVRGAYEQVFGAIKLNIKFTVYEIEEFGDLAYVRTSSAGKTTILDNGAVVSEGNNELFVFRKEDGDWKIHRYIFSTSNPR